MGDNGSKILAAALRLPAEARAALAGTLIQSLDEEVDEDAEAAWADEISRRLQELDAGKTPLISWVDARRRIMGK